MGCEGLTNDCCRSLRRILISAEMAIEMGDSWLVAKTIVVERFDLIIRGIAHSKYNSED